MAHHREWGRYARRCLLLVHTHTHTQYKEIEAKKRYTRVFTVYVTSSYTQCEQPPWGESVPRARPREKDVCEEGGGKGGEVRM